MKPIGNPVYHNHQITPRPRRVLSRLGNSVFDHFYRMVNGKTRVSPLFAKRAIAAGLDKDEVESALRQATSHSALTAILLSFAHDNLQKAIYWDDLGLKGRARDNYIASSLWGLFAEIAADKTTDTTALVWHYRERYMQAAPYFKEPAQPVEIAYLGGALKGYLRIPLEEEVEYAQESLTKFPCTVLLNPFGTPKEEMHLTENALLAQGIATLSFDYPSTSELESAGNIGQWFDTYELGTSLCSFLASQDRIDVNRIGMLGLSMGARLALSIASCLPAHFKAVASLSAIHDNYTHGEQLTETMRKALALKRHDSDAAVTDIYFQSSLGHVLPLLRAPVLVAGGGRDFLSDMAAARAIYELCGSSDKKLILCPSGSHLCPEMMPSLRYEIAQWVKQRL